MLTWMMAIVVLRAAVSGVALIVERQGNGLRRRRRIGELVVGDEGGQVRGACPSA